MLETLGHRGGQMQDKAAAINASRQGFFNACVRAWAALGPSKEEFEKDAQAVARFISAVTGASRQHGSSAKPAGSLTEVHLLAHSLRDTTDKSTQLGLMQELTAYFENLTAEEIASFWEATAALIESVSDDPSLLLICCVRTPSASTRSMTPGGTA